MAEIQRSSSGLLEIDYSSACLRHAGLPLQLRPKSFDVLAYFSRNRGRLISKAELIDHIWGDIEVTENSLVQCIKDIRDALAGESQFEIRTVPKRGYLFEGVLSEATASASQASMGRFPALPDRPSIAVLPFDNLSEEPDAGAYRRWHDRRPDHRIVPYQMAVRDRAQLDLHLQGSRGWMSARLAASSACAMWCAAAFAVQKNDCASARS